MKEHLDLIAKSYDEGIDLGKKGIDSYENLPPHITNHPYYPLFEQTRMNETPSDSARKEIVETKKKNVKAQIKRSLPVFCCN